MARCAMFLTDLFQSDGISLTSSGETSTLPRANVSDSLPGKPYQQLEAQDGGGAFEVVSGVNDLVYVNEGGGAITVTVPSGYYSTAASLISAVAAAVEADGGTAFFYSGIYIPASRKFLLSSTGSFSLVNTSTTRNLLTISLGWSETLTGSATSHTADEARSSGVTWLKFAMPSGESIAPNLVALMLSSTGGADADPDDVYNDVTVYAHATDLGQPQAAWDGVASLQLDVSDRPENAENTLQAAVTSDATGYRYWAVYWRHVDDHAAHRVNICRAMAATMSATRTCREISNHNLADPTAPRTLANQHPSERKKGWEMTAELERWESDDYRAFMVAAQRYGKVEGMVWSLRWTDILAGTHTVTDEADDGLIFYGSIRDWSATGYSTSGSDRMTGQITFGQLVP